MRIAAALPLPRRIAHSAVLAVLLAVSARAGAGPWSPQPYTVAREDAAGRLTLSTPYYAIEHDLRKGGAIARIALTHGRAKNLLVRPLESSVQLASPEGRPASEREAPTVLTFSDLHDASASVVHRREGASETVTVTAALLDAKGTASGVTAVTTYSYQWGYLRIRKEFRAAGPLRVRNICALNTVLDPSLTDYGYRPSAREQMDPELFSWRAAQIRGWGKLRAGTHFDLPLQLRHLPTYLVFANPGIEGLEWFMSDDLHQWDYQMTGIPGTGWANARTVTEPPGVALSIYPVILSTRYELPKGGAVKIQGSYVFDYYLGFPILENHAHKPWLNRSYNVQQGPMGFGGADPGQRAGGGRDHAPAQ